MKKMVYYFVMQLVAAVIFTSVSYAQEYTASVDKSTVKWEAKKVVAGGHNGTLALKSGSLVLKNGVPVKGNVVIDMNSLANTDLNEAGKKRLIGHLKSDDFFSVEKFPDAVFIVKNAETTDDGMVKVTGDLSIKGITNPLSFKAKMNSKNDALTVSGTMSVDRTLYDVKYGSGKFFDDLGDKAINDNFTLEFMLYLK